MVNIKNKGLLFALLISRWHCTLGELDEETATKMETARRWVEEEFQPSTLSIEEQMAEMEWLIAASKPYAALNLTVKVVSETIDTHMYESTVLAQAFREITGINLVHELLHEGEVVETLQQQFSTGENFYDAYISDSDLIGTHFRYDFVYPVSEYIKSDGAAITLPNLDLNDFIGASFVTAPDGKMYQLPDQQFANLYWFRADWFDNADIKTQFKNLYGYELGVPLNWKAYDDIANFFTNQVNGDGTIDGRKIYGHMDYGNPDDASLSWRFHDAWFSMAGTGSEGIPNGQPVDEWGIRAIDNACTPVGSSVSRGGATNAPASVYALNSYLKWLNEYAPPNAANLTFSDSAPVLAEGNTAQQIFWYTTYTKSMIDSAEVTGSDGKPKWRMAPSPHGAYWREGMKTGYQDCGAWTFLRATPPQQRDAAWLYAQFVVSKTTSLKKSIEGLTFIRDSDINSEYFTENAWRYGGLIEFYRSPARLLWSPTGVNVPAYPQLAPLWFQHIATAVRGDVTAQEALDNLAAAQDEVMANLQTSGEMARCAPVLNEAQDPQFWLDQEGSPFPKLDDEETTGLTIAYDELLRSWNVGTSTDTGDGTTSTNGDSSIDSDAGEVEDEEEPEGEIKDISSVIPRKISWMFAFCVLAVYFL